MISQIGLVCLPAAGNAGDDGGRKPGEDGFFSPGNADCGSDQQQSICRDTATVGPVLIGPGFGAYVRLAPSVYVVLAVQSLFGIPRFTGTLDGNLGLAFFAL